jgi:hypothetical protein
MLAQGAVAAIRSGCDMLKEGKAFIDDFKGEAEGAVNQITSTVKEVRGLLAWATGLWNQLTGSVSSPIKPTVVSKKETSVPAETIKAAEQARKKKAKSPSEMSYEEYQAKAVHDILQHMKTYFEAIRALKIHCRELEEEALTTDRVADSALDLIEVKWQMSELSKQVREAMSWTPESLGLQDLYRNFLTQYDEILEAQEFERQLKIQKQRDEQCRQSLLRNHRIDRAVASVGVVLLILWMWGVLLSFGWLVKTPAGSLQRLLFSA